MSTTFTRRRFLRLSAMGMGAIVISSSLMACNDSKSQNISFLHGVASGDPLQDKVILWTRVTPESESVVTVSWEVATDKEFTNLVRSGSTTTSVERDYTVKIDAVELLAATTYYYRFKAGNNTSPVGTTRTLPEGDVSQVKLMVVSCSNYPAGFFNVYREGTNVKDLDAVLHLGDYIYEYDRDGYASADAAALGREVLPAGELLTLSDYRTRYGQYRSDTDLQALHQAVPFITVWDDHEVANDSWKDGAENHNEGEGDYEERKLAAMQAYFEWLPIRPVVENNTSEIYRSFSWGNLVDLHMLDTRLIGRDEPLSIVNYVNPSTGLFDYSQFSSDVNDINRTMMGAEQVQWLEVQIANSTGIWQVLGQQVLMGKMELPAAVVTQQLSLTEYAELGALAQLAGRIGAGDPTVTAEETAFFTANQAKLTPEKIALLQQPNIPYNPDAWDGYPVERENILSSIFSENKSLVVLAGDTHNAWANNLVTDDGDAVGVEFATSSVSSPGLETILGVDSTNALATEAGIAGLISNLKYTNLLERGFIILSFTTTEVSADFKFISTVESKDYTLLPAREKTITVAAGSNQIS